MAIPSGDGAVHTDRPPGYCWHCHASSGKARTARRGPDQEHSFSEDEVPAWLERSPSTIIAQRDRAVRNPNNGSPTPVIAFHGTNHEAAAKIRVKVSGLEPILLSREKTPYFLVVIAYSQLSLIPIRQNGTAGRAMRTGNFIFASMFHRIKL